MKKNKLFQALSLPIMAMVMIIVMTMAITPRLFAQQTSYVLRVSVQGQPSLNLSLEQIRQLPSHLIDNKDKNGDNHQYKGVYVQDVLTKAGATMGAELHGKNLSKYVLAICADGYQVLYSLAELDSNFVSKRPIIAYQMDGQPLSATRGPLRIINPNDNKPARNCFQLKALSVQLANKIINLTDYK